MPRDRWLLAALAAANLALVLAFPPYDYVTIFPPRAPTFDGFHFVLSVPSNRRLNGDFFALEIIVVLVNAAIGWLLLKDRGALPSERASRSQQVVLGLVALNLLAMLLFPPFENSRAVSQATLPSFDGFYFVFLDNSGRQLVPSILWIEVSLVLANGLLFWLLLRSGARRRLTPGEVQALARELQVSRKRGG